MERVELLGRVLKEDKVTTDAQPPSHPKVGDFLARNLGNAVKALVQGYEGTFRVFPDASVTRTVDYTHLVHSGSLGWNVPPGVAAVRGKVVKETFYHKRHGKVRPTT